MRVSRRHLLGCGVAGLAGGSLASLTLPVGAAPTQPTPDVHEYEAYLDASGIPQVQPAGKWEPSYRDILGPYHHAGAPFRGKVTPPLEPGELLVISGRVWGFDTKKPVNNAVLDVWQADARGRYDMEEKSELTRSEFRNRIRLVTDETGYYEYETIKPAPYGVGRGGPMRPAHIHYMTQAPGSRKLIPQLYFKGDPHIQRDPTASRSNLVIETKQVKNENGTYMAGWFDVVLEGA